MNSVVSISLNKLLPLFKKDSKNNISIMYLYSHGKLVLRPGSSAILCMQHPKPLPIYLTEVEPSVYG